MTSSLQTPEAMGNASKWGWILRGCTQSADHPCGGGKGSNGIMEDALKQGGRARRGPGAGGKQGNFVPPVTDFHGRYRRHGVVAMTETLRARWPAVIKFDTESRRMKIANDYPLWSLPRILQPRHFTGLWRVADCLEAGIMASMRFAVSNATRPLGGVKASESRREG